MASATKDQMLRYHLTVVTSDKRLRRDIKRVTAATNSTAEFLDETAKLEPVARPDLVIFDARAKAPPSNSLAAVPRNAAISYIVEGDSLFERIGLLRDERVESILAHDERLDDDEFIASATKTLSHDLFGLHKYFPWGTTTFSMKVNNYDDKTEAISIIMQYAETAGMRGPVRERIQLACDELMMNALYHAPVDEQGRERYRDKSRKELAKLSEVSPTQVQYGCSGRYFGVSVRDVFGSLNRGKILDYLTRISQGVGATIETKTTGAGLGIVSVAQSVSKLIYNIIPGVSTEVIALFDTDLMSRGKVGARSVHLFITTSSTASASDGDGAKVITDGTKATAKAAGSSAKAAGNSAKPTGDDDAGSAGRDRAIAAPRAASSLPWLVVALLLSIATAMGIAYLFTRHAPAPDATTLAIVTEPVDATIRVNGAPIDNQEEVPLPEAKAYELSVEKEGHRTWRKTFSYDEMRANLRLYVHLSPEK
jgi:hypothetical protein